MLSFTTELSCILMVCLGLCFQPNWGGQGLHFSFSFRSSPWPSPWHVLKVMNWIPFHGVTPRKAWPKTLPQGGHQQRRLSLTLHPRLSGSTGRLTPSEEAETSLLSPGSSKSPWKCGLRRPSYQGPPSLPWGHIWLFLKPLL